MYTTLQLSVKDNHLTTNSVLPSIPEVRMGPLNLSIKLILLSTMKSRFIDTIAGFHTCLKGYNCPNSKYGSIKNLRQLYLCNINIMTAYKLVHRRERPQPLEAPLYR